MPVEQAEVEVGVLLSESRGWLVEATALRALGRLAAMRGDFEAARRLVRDGRRPLAEAGLRLAWGRSAQPEAMVEELAGDLEAAVSVAREGFETLEEIGERAFASTNAAIIATGLCALHRDDEAADWAARGRELSPEDDMATISMTAAVDGILLARRGEYEQGEALARRAVADAEPTDFWSQRGGAYEALADVLAAAGKTAEARTTLEHALTVYEEKGVVPYAARVRRLIAEL
jgi:tetratricopeptide (TPR) repeat protein